MSRRYSTFAHPGVLAPLIVFGLLGLLAVIVLVGWML